ncbi:MAG TPA: hypothetical protein VGP04_04975, partial [Pseudonocardiaceae bacterium]|nr:hypothetical protein [Pseudonocardiaceae bacterium]
DPDPPARYAFGADVTGYLLPGDLSPPGVGRRPIPERGPPEAPVLVVSLGISLPCQVIRGDLRIACTAAYRG